MLFEDDTTLLSFFERYAEDDDYEGLKDAIRKYCGASNTTKPATEDQTQGDDNIEQVGTPCTS